MDIYIFGIPILPIPRTFCVMLIYCYFLKIKEPSETVGIGKIETHVQVTSGTLSLEDENVPMNRSEATSETLLLPLISKKEEAVNALYSEDDKQSSKEATVFEKVKGFIFGKASEKKRSKAVFDTGTDTKTPIQISSEPNIKFVGNLKTEEMKKQVATDTSTAGVVHEPIVRIII